MSERLQHFIDQIRLDKDKRAELTEIIQEILADTQKTERFDPHSAANTIQKTMVRMEESSPRHTITETHNDVLSVTPSSEEMISGFLEPDVSLSYLGKYPDLGKIAEGGMGILHRVRDVALNRTVVMKIIRKRLSENSTEVARFIEEAQISGQLQHPGIIPIYDLGFLDTGEVYFTMKEIQGKTLRAMLKKDRQTKSDHEFDLRRYIGIFHKACEAVAYAHKRGVVHRDLKPSNIMIGDFGEVLVVDWGIAQLKSQSISVSDSLAPFLVDTSVAGTPSYMSPEQAAGFPSGLDERCDVYSMGVVLYKILSDALPYTGDSIAILSDIMENKAVPLSERLEGKGVPIELVAICETAMSWKAGQRYSSMEDFSQAILSWLDGVRRKEKATEILNQVRLMHAQMRKLEERAVALRVQMEERIQTKGVQDEALWVLWDQICNDAEECASIKQESEQILLGALIYDPDRLEIHRFLMEIEFKGYLDAIFRGDKVIERKVERKLNIHMARLPRNEQDYWLQRRNVQVDSINSMRKRRGRFFGRVALQRELTHILDSAPILTIVGASGLGKTRLALEIASIWRDRSNRNAYFCDLHLVEDRLGLIRAFSDCLNIRLTGSDSVESLALEINKKDSLLIAVVNLDGFLEEAKRIFATLLQQAPNLRLIAVGQSPLLLPGEQVHSLAPLSLLESMELFVHKAQNYNSELSISRENAPLMAKIVRKLRFLPLALEVVAAQTLVLSLSDIYRKLSNSMDLVYAKGQNREEAALLGTLEWSWTLLTTAAQQLLLQCSVFQGGFSLEAAENVVCLNEKNASVLPLLELLCKSNLMVRKRHGENVRYSMLSAIQEFASKKRKEYEQLHPSKSILLRHAEYYSTLFDPEKIDLLAIELDNFIEATQTGAARAAAQCCQMACLILQHHGPVAMGISVTSQYIRRDDVPPVLRDRISILQIQHLRISGRIQEARDIAEEMLSAAETIRSTEMAKRIQGNISPLEHFLSLMNSYLSDGVCSSFSSTVYEQKKVVADALIEKGKIETTQAQFQSAIEVYHRALRLYREIGERKGEGSSFARLGIAVKRLGAPEESRKLFLRSLEIHKERGDRSEEADVLYYLGNLCLDIGDYDEALGLYQQSLGLHQALGAKASEGMLLSAIATIQRLQGKYEDCVEHTQRALKIHLDTGNRRSEAISRYSLGLLYLQKGRHKDALSSFFSSLAIHKVINNKNSIGYVLGGIGNTYCRLGEYDKANQINVEARALHRQVKSRHLEAKQTLGLGTVYYERGEYEKSLACMKESMEILKEQNERHEVAIAYLKIGWLYYSMGDLKHSKASFEEAKQQYTNLGAQGELGAVLGGLGMLALEEGDLVAARTKLEKAIEMCQKARISQVGLQMSILAGVEAMDGNKEKAKVWLEKAQPWIREWPYAQLFFLFWKARVALSAADVRSARLTYTTLKQKVRAMNLHSDHLVYRTIKTLAGVLGD
ncbi:MAG: tetratricopeptide repeat protein [Myxococcota bacterium]|nr:tetratricopeptide repeat protein [Myxococcota bacterium]